MPRKSVKRKSKKTKRIVPRLLNHDTSKTLGNPDLVFKTVMECLTEGDHEAAIEVITASLELMNKTKLERLYGIPRRTSYNLLERKSIPRLDFFAKICHAINLEAANQQPY